MNKPEPQYYQQQMVLLRHPKPLVEAGICYGQLDLPLNTALHSQNEPVLQQLADLLQPFAIQSSPLQRCAVLAKFLAGTHKAVQLDPAWQELNFGDWEGQNWSDIEPQAINAWQQNLADFVPPSGESARQMQARVLSAWQQLLQNRQTPMVLVSHLGVIRMILAELLSAPFSAQLRLKVDYQHGVLLKRSWLAETIAATPVRDSEVWQIEAINLSPQGLIEHLSSDTVTQL